MIQNLIGEQEPKKILICIFVPVQKAGNVIGAFLNKMAGYNADGTILLHPGGYWYLLEFHHNDTIAGITRIERNPVQDII